MSFRFAELPWLPPAPADFTPRRRALVSLDPVAAGAEVRALAGCRLAPVQAAALGSMIATCGARGGGLPGFEAVKLAVLAGSTFDLLSEQFAAAAARHGVALNQVSAGYDQVEVAAFDPDSPVNRARADFALIAVDHRWLRLDRFSPADADAHIESALQRLEAVARALQENGGAAPILCTLPTPPDTTFGGLDASVMGTPAQMIATANRRILDLAAALGGAVLDVAGLSARIGTDAWFDPDAWFAAKLAFSPQCDAAYAEHLGRLLGALRGRARRALVLDLDNTLWGGVVGDDGRDALRLGPGDAEGEAFAAVQAYALDLHRRGVFLAIASKNDEAMARHAFETHPGMVLKPEHIAVFQANWRDKPSNLEAIAAALNIGTDALVFLDDNPAERAEMRAALPEVATPELPLEPSGYVRALAAAGYFEAVTFSTEDASRAVGGKAESLRAEVKGRAGTLGDYLSSLQMVLTVSPFDAAGRGRIVQLINKTNQFNLNGRRYSKAEVAALEADPTVVALQARLADRFGDLGMISVLIARQTTDAAAPALQVETWLMSCRVMGRGVEEAMLFALLSAAETRGVSRLFATFAPTAKNGPVADLLPRLGFQAAASDDGEGRSYVLDVGAPRRPVPPIEIRFEP